MSTLRNSEIDAIEQSLNITLPGLYRKLLRVIGFGIVGQHAEIYHPNEVRALYEPFFDEPEQLFAPYFPFGCDNREQVLWVINAATIWHETVPDDWPDEEWLPYDEWIVRYLEPDSDAT